VACLVQNGRRYSSNAHNAPTKPASTVSPSQGINGQQGDGSSGRGSNLWMAVIREHLASKGLGLFNDLQNEHSVVGNFPDVVMIRYFWYRRSEEGVDLGTL